MKTVVLFLMLISTIFADEGWFFDKKNLIDNQLYIDECASCHMGYQPQFLPKRSWDKLMDNLNDHFGVDATFDKNDEKLVREFLLKNSSDTSNSYGYYSKFARSIAKEDTPIAISEITKFKKEHRKVPKRFITQKEVKTIANCIACHKDAKEGLYKERNIFIPNYGRWDD
jgi:nitrate/TMAO reductase-like tetraheme cytochrome c subunit